VSNLHDHTLTWNNHIVWRSICSHCYNKKFELMLMKRARAYSSSCSQYSLGLCPFVSSQFTLLQPKIVNKLLKIDILGVQGHSKLLILIPLKSTSSVLVLINSSSVPICNRFHARQANTEKITTFFEGGYRSLAPACASLLERKGLGRDLDCWNLRSMPKISYTGCICPCPTIWAQFTLEMCVAARNPEKIY